MLRIVISERNEVIPTVYEKRYKNAVDKINLSADNSKCSSRTALDILFDSLYMQAPRFGCLLEHAHILPTPTGMQI